MKKMDTQIQINYTKECNEDHMNILKGEILQGIKETFIEMLLDMVNQNVQETLKKFQDKKTKEYEKTQKQINDIIGALNKHQTETKITINREINELRAKIDNIKQEVTQDMETSEKKKRNRNTKQNGSLECRIEQPEDRISGLEDERAIKRKTVKLLNNSRPVKRKCKNSMTASKDQT
jgi:phenylalanyl-tRNA synthetase alpha subunit